MIIKKYFSKEEIKARMRMAEDENDDGTRKKDLKDNSEDEMEETRGTANSRLDLDSYSSLKKKQSQRRKGYDSNDEQCHSEDSEDGQTHTWNKRTSQRQKTAAAHSRRHGEDSADKRGSKRDTHRSKTFQERFRKREEDSESESEDDDDMRITPRKMNKLLKSHDDDSDDDDDSDEDEDVKIMKRKMKKILNKDSDESDDDIDDVDMMQYRKKSLIRKTKRVVRDSEEEDESESGASKQRVPLYDEYVLPCGRWLAKDEDDGSISRTLKVSTITTIYQVGSRLTDH